MGEEASRPMLRRAVELGINFFDTANTYSDGTSEEIVGRALRDFREARRGRDRDEGVLPDAQGTEHRRPVAEGDLHRDPTTACGVSAPTTWTCTRSIDGTTRRRSRRPLEALHDVVKAGKARYIGASSMFAWQFAKALAISERHGWTRFSTMQNHLNLLNREEEREMLPLCADAGIGVIPWSPMARGRLTRDWDTTSARSETDEYGRTLYTAHTADADRQVVEAVGKVASDRGIPRAQVALAWTMQAKAVTAPIIGASKPAHLDDAIAALSVTLTGDELAALAAPYVPHAVSGYS